MSEKNVRPPRTLWEHIVYPFRRGAEREGGR